MVSNTFGITPVLPTLAGDFPAQALTGTDLLLGIPLADIHYVPGLIDIERFKNALANALYYYPAYAGRVRHKETGQWLLELTNSPVPLEIAIDETRDPNVDYDFTVFDSPGDIAGLVVPINHFDLVNTDEPLMKVKLSLWTATNESVIGIVASHIVADGFNMARFNSCLSALYQGFTYPFPAPILNPDVPYHKIKPLDPPEMTPELQNMLAQVDPRLLASRHFPPDVVLGEFGSQEAETLPIRFRVSRAQSERLKQRVNAEAAALDSSKGGKIQLSKTDALAGLVVATINRFASVPIEFVRSNVDIRSAIPPEAASNNTLSILPSQHIPIDAKRTEHSDLYRQAARIGLAIRLALLDTRGPNSNILTMFALIQHEFRQGANRGDIYNILNPEGFATINSLAGFSWNTVVDFGFPGRVKHWVAWYWKNYLRIFQSNPELEPVLTDETPTERQVVDSREGSIDVHFRADKEIRDAIEATLKAELHDLQSGA